VGTYHAMGGHRSMLMVMVWVWVQIRRKMLGSTTLSITFGSICFSEMVILNSIPVDLKAAMINFHVYIYIYI
jgi:hypothetical protein